MVNLRKPSWKKLGLFLAFVMLLSCSISSAFGFQESPFDEFISDNSDEIYHHAQITTVLILAPDSCGSGVIIHNHAQTYTVLTNWHVVADIPNLIILTHDGQTHIPSNQPLPIDTIDLATLQFTSPTPYTTATAITTPLTQGQPTYASGFSAKSIIKTACTPKNFTLTQGNISLLPERSLPDGYRLGYTNDIERGMSGGPIFDTNGNLIGINGRIKYRDPAFGVYTFEDGTEPSEAMLAQMITSSWGIPIQTYLDLAPTALEDNTEQ